MTKDKSRDPQNNSDKRNQRPACRQQIPIQKENKSADEAAGKRKVNQDTN